MHNDGWLEENNLPKDSIIFKTWKANQVNLYSEFKKKWKKCSYRKNELQKLILFLKKRGTVVLVRMPIDAEILKIENHFWSDFNKMMIEIKIENKISYFDFSKDAHFKTYDGNHIDKFGGVEFSKQLCDSILKK